MEIKIIFKRCTLNRSPLFCVVEGMRIRSLCAKSVITGGEGPGLMGAETKSLDNLYLMTSLLLGCIACPLTALLSSVCLSFLLLSSPNEGAQCFSGEVLLAF